MNTLEKFWSEQSYKIYVVALSCRKGNKKAERRYIRITSKDDSSAAQNRAVMAAVNQSSCFKFGSSLLQFSVRLAHPERDLNCTWQGPAELNPFN